MNVTSAIARYVATTSLEDFPPEAVHAAKGAIMDCLGCAVAGSREPLADILCQFVQSNGGSLRASVVGRGFRTSAPDAALINGAMAHALDYDDITQVTKTHPSATLLPAALALAEETGATGQDVLLAYMLGFEVACSVGEALSPAYYDDLGWHPTGPLGALGAAVAASRILKLGQSQTAMAISLAASQSAGLRQNFGTMTKPFHAGAAARSGVVAAKLVQGGFTAGADALEGRFGFMRAFSGGAGFDPEQVLNTLGKKCYLVESGVEVKKYPCCGSAHLALDAMFTMLKRQRIDPAQVERIEVKVDFDPPRSLIHRRPKAALEGKFSMEYCLAAALLDRHIGLGTFTDQQVLRPEAQALIPRVHMYRIPGHEGQPSWAEGYHEVEVKLQDGGVLQEQAARANAGALRGVTLQDIQAKFRDCAAGVLNAGATEELLGLLDRLEELPSARRLADLLRGD